MMLHNLSNSAKLRRLAPALSQPAVSPQSALSQPPVSPQSALSQAPVSSQSALSQLSGHQLVHPAVYAVG